MKRDQVNKALRSRGFPELAAPADPVAIAERVEEARHRPDPVRDHPLRDDGPTSRERALQEVRRRFGATPTDAA